MGEGRIQYSWTPACAGVTSMIVAKQSILNVMPAKAGIQHSLPFKGRDREG